jgi:hypothetical protein
MSYRFFRARGTTQKTKLATTEVDRGASLFSSFERSAMLTSLAKAADRGGGSDHQKASRFLQDPGNLLFRQWALLHADATELAKRDTLLDDVVAKTRAAGDGAGGARALGGQTGGRTVLAVGTGSAGSKATEADKEREAAIEQQMRLGRWQTVEEAARYIDGLQAELDRMARRKQTIARPGTMERII